MQIKSWLRLAGFLVLSRVYGRVRRSKARVWPAEAATRLFWGRTSFSWTSSPIREGEPLSSSSSSRLLSEKSVDKKSRFAMF